jgi:acyl-CoA synthetase (AMP-forming)/AMP-acid ligase II
VTDLLHQVTMADVLAEHAAHTSRLAHVCGEDRHSYSDLDERTNRLANALSAVGVGHGDRILWLAQNCHRLMESMLAAAKLGAVLCPANWRGSADELAFVIEDSDPAVVIWQEKEIGEALTKAREMAEGAASTADASARKPHWIQHDAPAGSANGYEAMVAAADAAAPATLRREISVDESDAVLMLYTAAFAGKPGGALLSHRALVTQGALLGSLQGIGADYVYLNCGPLFHVATLMTTLATFVAGGTNVFTPRVDAEELCRLIQTEGCTGAFIMPPTISQILEINPGGQYDLHTLRTFPGKPAWTAMITPDDSPWGRHPGGYGQTEVMGLVSFGALGPCLGSHGRPAPFLRIGILDPEGHEVEQGETGEICVRGPTVMNGYFNRPELTEERRAGDWHHTNDLGRTEPDGSLTFIGPKSRLIKSAAENIYPTEVEGCLKTHEGVADAAVIGVPDRTWGQNVVAVVVLKEGADVTAEEIIGHCREHIASYKKPKAVEFVDSLPRQGWAVDYDALDATFGGGGYPGTGG